MPSGWSLKGVMPYVYTCIRGLFGFLKALELSCSVCWGVNRLNESIKISVILSKHMSMLLSVWENVSSPECCHDYVRCLDPAVIEEQK